MSDQTPLRALQLAELDILKQTLAIIEKHQLTYYMLGGTLLGAVRHGGFIPWDDDVDIGMPRPDYECFLKAAREELRPPYQLHTLQTNPGEYSYYFARVENTTILVRRTASIKEVIIPAWIDVFPLDGVPDDNEARLCWLKKCRRRYLAFVASQYSFLGTPANSKNSYSLSKQFLRQLFTRIKLERLISKKRAWEKLDRALKENDYDSSNSLINFCGYWGIKELFPKAIYGGGKLYPFEGLMLNGPEDYDSVLTQMYGDYMTPPPEDKRDHHHLTIISNPNAGQWNCDVEKNGRFER